MEFLFLFLALFCLLTLSFALFLFIYNRFLLLEQIIYITLNFPANQPVKEITEGPFVDLIKSLHKKYKTPLIRLYFIEKETVFTFLHLLFHDTKNVFGCPFFIPNLILSRSVIIFVDNDNSLNEQDKKWIICHEIGHLNFKTTFSCLFKSKMGFKAHLKSEIKADAFAAKVLGIKQSIETLQKIKISTADPFLPKRIEELKKKLI